ncbi:SDR family NAD(P)-dependent oxidoreductase [Massilia sp. TS11]|uniref:SDR family NAD(P)-dependent oxidoreductase n=1 Tax=Massilia sp. TS11 TaxID=2908003 RepID=UPI001ED9FFA4|nr:SDR family oxidoreductase [Massilia sp. TS11]MCG2586793.1 SDR family oxidoreductase [Massilia sp. TS11]
MSTPVAIYPGLAGKVAFVSGGATGIGAAIVEKLHAQGCRVAFVDIDARSAEQLCARLAAQGPAPLFIACDLCDLEALQAAIATVAARWGAIDVLVNNAAHDERHAIEAVTPAYFQSRIDVNLRHYFFAAQAVLPGMQQKRAGSIINFSSISYKIKAGNYPLYAMCKAAAHGLTRSMARDIGQHGVRVNTVTPGWVMTERQLALHVDAAGEAEIARNQCLPGQLLPGDLADMVLFLASDASRMCTAQEFVVDAGWT